MRLALVCFYCLCVLFMFSILSRQCPLLATSLSVLFCLLSMLISDSRFDLVWFRLSCDHGWIRSGSVNVRKQRQQQHCVRLQKKCFSSFCTDFFFLRTCLRHRDQSALASTGVAFCEKEGKPWGFLHWVWTDRRDLCFHPGISWFSRGPSELGKVLSEKNGKIRVTCRKT